MNTSLNSTKRQQYYAGDLESVAQTSMALYDEEINYFPNDSSRPNKMTKEKEKNHNAKNERVPQIESYKMTKFPTQNYEDPTALTPLVKHDIPDDLNQSSKIKRNYPNESIMSNTQLHNSVFNTTPNKILNDIEDIERSPIPSNRGFHNKSDVMQIKHDIERSFQMAKKKPPNFILDAKDNDTSELSEKVQKQLKDLKTQNEIFKEEINYLKRKKDGNSKDDLFNQLEQLQANLDQSQEENSRLKTENIFFKKEVESKSREILILRNQVEEFTKQGGQIDIYCQEINALKTNYELLFTEYQNLTSTQTSVKANLTKENVELNQKLQELQSVNLSLKNTINELTEKNKALMKKNSENEEFRQSLMAKNSFFEQDSIRSLDANINQLINRTKKNILETISDAPHSPEPNLNEVMPIKDPIIPQYVQPSSSVHQQEYKPLKAQAKPDGRRFSANPNNKIDEKPKFEINYPPHRGTNIAKVPKGLLVTEKFLDIDHVINRLLAPSSLGDIINFKIACLEPQAILCSNEYVQIGVTAVLFFNQRISQNNIKLALYYGNIGDDSIKNFNTGLVDDDKHLISQVDDEAEIIIMIGNQTKQLFTFGINRVPYKTPTLVVSYITNNQMYEFKTILPITINKFMNFKPNINPEEFKSIWRSRKFTRLRSEMIELNKEIIANIVDLKHYFDGLITLKMKVSNNPQSDKSDIKFGGIFELDIPNYEYLIKILVFKNEKILIQITYDENTIEIAKFLVITLAFLLSK